MGLSTTLQPAIGMFSKSLATIGRYWWVLIPIVLIISIGAIIFVIKKWKKKKSQWTHKLEVRRVIGNNLLSKPIIFNMRRFPLVNRAVVFELEKPLLGCYLIPELDKYSDLNTYSIILDKNNRIYVNEGEYFNPDNSCVNVSARHAEIDIQIENLKANFQNVNKISKRIEWATIAKYGFMAMVLIVVCIIAIKGLESWGNAQEYKAQQAQAEAQAMENLGKAIDTTTENSKVNILIIERLEKLYGKENLQSIIKQELNK